MELASRQTPEFRPIQTRDPSWDSVLDPSTKKMSGKTVSGM